MDATLTIATVIFHAADGSIVGTSAMSGGSLIRCPIPAGAVTLDLVATITPLTASQMLIAGLDGIRNKELFVPFEDEDT